MRHKYPVLTVKKLLKSVSIYGSYRKNKTGVPFFWNTLYAPGTFGGFLKTMSTTFTTGNPAIKVASSELAASFPCSMMMIIYDTEAVADDEC